MSGALFPSTGKNRLSTGIRLRAPNFSLPKNPTLAGNRCSSYLSWDMNPSPCRSSTYHTQIPGGTDTRTHSTATLNPEPGLPHHPAQPEDQATTMFPYSQVKMLPTAHS